MNIKYKNNKRINKYKLINVFKSINWESANYPDRLSKALKNSNIVITAWHGKKLVGLVNAITDKNMVVYIHYLLVDPNYHNNGIGKKLMNLLLNKCKDVRQKIIIADNTKIDFYKKVGFNLDKKFSSMHINSY